MKRHIPNILTCCNLVSGCVAIHYALAGLAAHTLLFILIGAVFDFADGWSARLIGVSSPIGKELDSLADCVTFGVAPSLLLFANLQMACDITFDVSWRSLLPFTAFVMAAFSALRLAKFNLDERQTTSFIGLPTPANALFWASLLSYRRLWLQTSEYAAAILIALMLLCSWLLVSELPMFALKFKHYRWIGNRVKYTFLGITTVVLLVMGVRRGICIAVMCYVAMSIIIAWRQNARQRKP